MNPPIDPLQLLKALAPLLAPNGGMKSPDEVVRLSSLMKKFSRKLVSRCVYVNVLRSTTTEVLEAFLCEGGWETINMWLQESRSAESEPFLVELLRLFKQLPMTVGRLKENNSAKLVKAFAKSESHDVRVLATEIVESWMKLIKGETSANITMVESKETKPIKKKKRKDHKEEIKKETIPEKERRDSKENLDKKHVEEKKVDVKKTEHGGRKNEKPEKVEKYSKENAQIDLEDVKLPDYVAKELVLKKPKRDRPKTVKTYQAKFRSTGLEEIMPLPKPVSKKNSVVDKATALAAKNAVKRIGITLNKEYTPPEKKVKPSTLVVQNSEILDKPGIKLIPPKPKPVHIIKESAGFMDALVGEPSAPTKKKRKSSRNNATPTSPAPVSPTATTPKLQFYKDTLDTQNEGEKISDKDVESNNSEDAVDTASVQSEEANDNIKEVLSDSTAENDEISENEVTKLDEKPSEEPKIQIKKKVKQKKKVSWAEESQLRQTYYFELDETERGGNFNQYVNVNNIKNFGDLKTLERMKERQAVETARRMQMGDKMEEKGQWVTPFLIDMQATFVDRGCNSTQKEIQHAREQGILQEIYFSKDSIPDCGHEPDPEFFEPEEPKVIPLDDENNPDSIVDYSMMEPPAPVTVLPPALSNLMLNLNNKSPPHNPFGSDTDMRFNEEMPPEPYFHDEGSPNFMPPPIMPPGPPGFDQFVKYPPGPHDSSSRMPSNAMMEEDFGDYYENMPPPPLPMVHPNMGPRMRHPGPGPGPGPMRRGMGPPRGRGMGMGPPRGMMRGRGGPGFMRNRGGRILCRHFVSGGCKFEESCKFLHPGINGPL